MMGTILIIEDDEDIRANLAAILLLKGFAVIESANGKEALQRMRAEVPPSVILLDLRMPIMNGWEFLAALGEDAQLAKIPVIICSGDGSIDPRTIARNAIAYLRKPFELSELLDLVAPFR
jgi:CheY-like chemotaxis protein